MRLEKLAVPPLNTTFMGVVHGVLRYWDQPVDFPTVFGVSGHAFVINIHEGLCPSGPYCWNMKPVTGLLENLGVKMTDLGFFSHRSSEAERGYVENRMKEALDRGSPCSLLNMEHQLITGYDETGFFTTQPWPQHDFPPSRLSFGSWAELGSEVHMSFYSFERVAPADPKTAARAALRYAIDLYDHPEAHERERYGVGPHAYARWSAAIAEHGASHGNWWNATVWAECRTMAGRYIASLGAAFPALCTQTNELSGMYERLGTGLAKASEKTMPSDAKLRLVEDLAHLDADCVNAVRALVVELETA